MSSVYILGAGATKAVAPDAPLMADLLPEGLREFSGDPRIESVREFVNIFFLGLEPGDNPNGLSLPRLEDLLTIVDSAIYEKRPFSGAYPLPKLEEIRNNIVFLISKLLQSRLRDFRADFIQGFFTMLRSKDALISLNYDIILDNALLSFYENHLDRNAIFDYGTKLRYLYLNFPEGRMSAESLRQHDRAPALFKLHGSLNWLYCPSCHALDVTLREKGVIRVFSELADRPKCSLCRHDYEPLIITPTFLKVYANGLLVEIWRRAEEAIAKASHIIFVGYSLPDSDILIKTMIKRATYNNAVYNDGQLPRITVVGIEQSGGDLEQRFKRLFGSKVEYHPEGFQPYVQGLQPQAPKQ